MQMRKALATTALTAGLALGGAPLLASPAWAVSTAAPGVTAAAATSVAVGTQNGEDHIGRYGLIGLSGLLGLFGYKKYQDLRANRSSKGGPIGGVDTDESGSRRV